MNQRRKELIRKVFDRLFSVFGPQHWWPAETPFEMILGALLAQNTAWKNVEQCINTLRDSDCLNLQSLIRIHAVDLAALIRPSRYYNQKARNIKAFCSHLEERWNSNLHLFLSQEMEPLRSELLGIRGIGPETADSIILYAAHQPSFVVDAYTYRIFSRHAWVGEDLTYGELRDYFMDVLEPDVYFFKELHALIVRAGHLHCRRRPACRTCPLSAFIPDQDETGDPT